MHEPVHIHLHPNRLNRNHNIFLFFIPAIVFALILAFLISRLPKKEVASTTQPSILGEDAEKLDK